MLRMNNEWATTAADNDQSAWGHDSYSVVINTGTGQQRFLTWSEDDYGLYISKVYQLGILHWNTRFLRTAKGFPEDNITDLLRCHVFQDNWLFGSFCFQIKLHVKTGGSITVMYENRKNGMKIHMLNGWQIHCL